LETESIQAGDHLPLPRMLPEPQEPLSHLSIPEILASEDRVYAAMPMFSEVWAHGAPALRPLLPAGRASAVLAGERVSLAVYQKAVALFPALARDARFAPGRGGREVPCSLEVSDGLLRFIGYYVGEGHAEDGYTMISSVDQEIVADFLS